MLTDPGPEGSNMELELFKTLINGGWICTCGFGTILLSNVTAAYAANTLPSTFAPSIRETDEKANIFPFKKELVPSVAELPPCQKHCKLEHHLRETILLDPAVVIVEQF